MIWKLIRRNIGGKPFRFLLTCSAVTAGVMFTVGIFVFTDGLRATFGELADTIEGNVDLDIRTAVEFGGDINRPPVDPAVAVQVAEIPGVMAVQPRVIDFTSIPLDGEGEPLVANQGPNVAFNWEDEAPTLRMFLQDGRPPVGPDEFAMDATSFEGADFTVNESYTIQTPLGPRDFVLVGTFSFGQALDDLISVDPVQLAFDTPTAVEVLNQGAGYDDIAFYIDEGADRDAVIDSVAAGLPADLEIVPGGQLQDEQADQFDDILSIFQTVLLVFAFIILIVSAFVIYNVFSILIGQRIRELGLLRAIGATGRQVTWALIGEAAMVALFATVVGTALGIWFGWTLRWLLQQFDFGPEGNDLLLEPDTFIAGAAVGILVTMASAIAPALRARHVSPMAALRDDARLSRVVPDRNLLLGIVVTLASWAIVLFGLLSKDWQAIVPLTLIGAFGNVFGLRRIHPTAGRFATLGLGIMLLIFAVVLDLGTTAVLSLLGVAAVTLFLGVNAISPFLAQPVSNLLGRWPLAILLGLGGLATALVGLFAILGSGFLIVASAWDLVTDFDMAGVLGLLGALILLALAVAIFSVGRRSIDASFIMGWPWHQVLAGIVIFLVGAVGVVGILTGLAALLEADWDRVPMIGVGAFVLGLAWFARRWVPHAMKSNARMARENAGRSPRRTASAAAALMIGLALVSTATVVADSFKATFADILDTSVTSDWFISPENQQNPNSGFSTALGQDLAELPEVDSVVAYRFAFEAFVTGFDGLVRDSSATDLADSLDHIDPDFVELDESLLDRDAIWVHEDFAADNDFEIGSSFPIEFNDGQTETVTVAGIFRDSSIYGNRVVSNELWDVHFETGQDQFASVTVAEGVSEDEARTAIEAVSDGYPQLNVDTRDEFQERQEGQIDQILIVFNVLLLVAIVIALLGIAITLALSVFERTRELGLVRAVGMTAQQMLRMVLFEGAIIAVFGGVLGVVLGTIFGSAAVVVIPDTFIRTLSIPVPSLLQYLAIASIAGIAAAIIPARRAARLNVLEAISQE